MKIKRALKSISVAALALFPAVASAATYTWSGLSSIDWFDIGNWDSDIPDDTGTAVVVFDSSAGRFELSIGVNEAVRVAEINFSDQFSVDMVGGSQVFISGAGISGSSTITAGNTSYLEFSGSSSAGNVTLIGGEFHFIQNATAGNADITNTFNGYFEANANAGNATISNSGTLFFNGNATAQSASIIHTSSGSVVDFRAHNAGTGAIGSFNGGGTILGQSGISLELGASNLNDSMYASVQGFDNVSKVGTGTLSLQDGALFSSKFTVDSGTVSVDGSIDVIGGLSVSGGGTVIGTGTVKGDAAINGILAPGTMGGIGTITLQQSVTFSTGSTLLLDIDHNTLTNDSIVIGGNVTIDPGAILSVNINELALYTEGQSIQVLTANNVTGSFVDIVDSNNRLWTFGFENGIGSLSLAPVPESSAYAALSGALILASVVLHRRRR